MSLVIVAVFRGNGTCVKLFGYFVLGYKRKRKIEVNK